MPRQGTPEEWDQFIGKVETILVATKPDFVREVKDRIDQANLEAHTVFNDHPGLPKPKEKPAPAYTPPPPRREQPERAVGHCSACGVPWDEQTPGCNNCYMRHKSRGTYIRTGPRTECKNCGVPIDDNNPNCYICDRRHYQRRRAEQRRTDNPLLHKLRPMINKSITYLEFALSFNKSTKRLWWVTSAQADLHNARVLLIDERSKSR